MKVPHRRLDWLAPAAMALVGCLGMVTASPLVAQTKTREELLAIKREDCRTAQRHAADSPAPSSGVLVNLAQCPAEGGATLPTVWQRMADGEPDSILVKSLMNATSNLRDGRIASILFAIAEDSTKAPQARGAAITVLTSYVETSIRGRVDRSLVPRETWIVVCAQAVDVDTDDGAVPLDPDFRARLSSLLDAISKDKVRVSLGRLARVLRPRVSP